MVFYLLVQWNWGGKAEELVSLGMEGFKNWRRAGLFAPFQLEFDSAVRLLLLCPRGSCHCKYLAVAHASPSSKGLAECVCHSSAPTCDIVGLSCGL